MHPSLRSFLETLTRENEIITVRPEVDPALELAEVHRRVIANQGPALFFKRVKGSKFPVVTNLFGTKRRIDLAFGPKPELMVRELVNILESVLPPKPAELWKHRNTLFDLLRLGTTTTRRSPVTQVLDRPPQLDKLPVLTTWQEDGGPFITLPLVYTEHPVTGKHNLGVYRMQVYDDRTAGLHWQIQKGGGFHYHEAERLDQSLPVTVFLGGPPALMLAAIAPLPEDVPELVLASLLNGQRLKLSRNPLGGHRLVAEAEFALLGHALPRERKPEGPFGDHYGYYSLRHDYPVFHADAIFHRRDAVYPATVVGKPRQEDFFIGDYLQSLLSPLFPLVMPSVRDLWTYGETGFHSLCAAVVKERYAREALVSGFRILGEGQLSLTKFLILTDTPQDLKDFPGLLEHVLARFRPETDLFVIANVSMDTLDYTSGKVNEGSKAIMLGLGDSIRTLPREFRGTLPRRGVCSAQVFCAGCLVLEAVPFNDDELLASRVATDAAFSEWPLIVLHDSAKVAQSTADFLWATWTRFEPAADIYAAKTAVQRHHLMYQLPIVIDARTKPGFPKELLVRDDIAALVDKRWDDYFPKNT